jgi:hypothetical protein
MTGIVDGALKSHLILVVAGSVTRYEESRWRDGLMAMPLAGLELTCVPGIAPIGDRLWYFDV